MSNTWFDVEKCVTNEHLSYILMFFFKIFIKHRINVSMLRRTFTRIEPDVSEDHGQCNAWLRARKRIAFG